MAQDKPASSNTAENFTSETTDDCADDARTELNRKGSPNPDNGADENVEQRAQEHPADQPPKRTA